LFLFIVCGLGSLLTLNHNFPADMTSWFGMLPIVFLFFIPALTMRLWAEERKAGTLELLLTFPVTIPQLIAGKFFASMTYLAVLLLCTMWMPLNMASFGTLDWYPVLVTYLAALLMAAAYVAVGMFWSSVTRDQIIALILSMVMLGLLYSVAFWGPLLIGTFPAWLGGDAIVLFLLALSPQQYFVSISRGIADTGDLVFYAAFCVFFLHANALVLYGKKVKG
jgi:ABC-type transport system involved in multi-copper enzyme maturation permease subunit